MDPPLKIKILLGSNSLTSTISVRGLVVLPIVRILTARMGQTPVRPRADTLVLRLPGPHPVRSGVLREDPGAPPNSNF